MAVNASFRTKAGQSIEKSIFGSFCLRILFIYLFVACWSCADAGSCANIKTFYDKQHLIPLLDLQEQPNSDIGGLCKNSGCCGPDAKKVLLPHVRNQMERLLKSHILGVADTLANKASDFNTFFRKLLTQSRIELRDMFKKTYGMIYEQHSYVFEDLFNKLEQYYVVGDINLPSTMKYFFGILYEKMFTVINSQYVLKETYLNCVKGAMHKTQPFADVPEKLSVQLGRALVATRTFYLALDKASQIVRSIAMGKLGDECIEALTRMQFCGRCAAINADQEKGHLPCSRYCNNILHGCLHYYADLDPDWDAFLDVMEKVSDRLLGPFNIVMVVEPIDIKISEAIMHFQEHSSKISKIMFDECGQPELYAGNGGGPFFQGRTKRSPRSIPDFDWNHNPDDDFVVETSFENVLNEDPSLLNIKSSEDMPEIVEKMKKEALIRGRFLRYMRDEIDQEEYDDEEEKERTKRDTLDYKAYDFEAGKKPRGGGIKKNAASKDDWATKSLDGIVHECRSKIRTYRNYFKRLPYTVCTDVSKSPSGSCFNGTDFSNYKGIVAASGTAGLASNPEVNTNNSVKWSFSDERERLKMITANLRDAYNGHEVHWSEPATVQSPVDSDSITDRAGSGSGDGADSDDEDLYSTDVDDEDDDDISSGAGANSNEDDYYNVTPEPKQPTEPHPYDVPEQPSVIRQYEDSKVIVDEENKAIDNIDVDENVYVPPVKEPEQPEEKPTAAASRPSLQKALFMYAMPVMCAWFGTMVTDLF